MINKIINPSSSVKTPNLIGAKVKAVSELARSSVFFPFTQPTVKSPTGKVIKGRMPSMNNVMKNFGLKSFGGKNDLDFDGIPNKLDCQPFNTMRQDEDDDIIFRGPRRKAREGEQWVKFPTPEGKTIIYLKKNRPSLKDVQDVVTSPWLSDDEKRLQLTKIGATASQERQARMYTRLKRGARRY